MVFDYDRLVYNIKYSIIDTYKQIGVYYDEQRQ